MALNDSQPFNPDEWVTQEQVATMLNVPKTIVWEKVRVLGPARAVRTRINPFDRRETLVFKADVDLIREAIFR